MSGSDLAIHQGLRKSRFVELIMTPTNSANFHVVKGLKRTNGDKREDQ